MKGIVLSIGFLLQFPYPGVVFGNDSTIIKVHFLYGSRPTRAFKDTEPTWFGGMLGGHVGIEVDSNKIIDFIPFGELHYFAHRHERHSKFAIHSYRSFWEIFGSPSDSVKKLSVIIPVSIRQKSSLDSIVTVYRNQTPYDYAFVGMRCGAAAYDILSQIGILKQYSYRRTYLKIFYPKKIRKRLLKQAEQYQWVVIRQSGTKRRKWERD